MYDYYFRRKTTDRGRTGARRVLSVAGSRQVPTRPAQAQRPRPTGAAPRGARASAPAGGAAATPTCSTRSTRRTRSTCSTHRTRSTARILSTCNIHSTRNTRSTRNTCSTRSMRLSWRQRHHLTRTHTLPHRGLSTGERKYSSPRSLALMISKLH